MLRMNKKGLRFKLGLFAIVAISMAVIAYGAIIDQQADKYGTSVVSNVKQYDKLDDVSSTAEGYEGSLTPEDPEPGEDGETATFRGVYGIITGLFNAFNIVTGDGGMIDDVVTQIGLPSYVRQGIVTLMFVAISFSLVSIIFRLSREFT